MIEQFAIPVAALIISVITLIISQVGIRQTASKDYITGIEHRVQVLERELELCRVNCERLINENLSLMRKLVGFDAGR